jgi:hypothetical protein
VDDALAAHLTRKDADLTEEQALRIQGIIEKARKEGL